MPNELWKALACKRSVSNRGAGRLCSSIVITLVCKNYTRATAFTSRNLWLGKLDARLYELSTPSTAHRLVCTASAALRANLAQSSGSLTR